MQPRFFNTLSRRVEPFVPLRPERGVSMYNCGPTVYDYAHIGNFRAFVFADVLRRFLELLGHRVHQVMNLTDVGHMTEDSLADGGGEDKMQVAARRLKEAKKSGRIPAGAIANPDDPYQVARYFIDAFAEDAGRLGLKVAGSAERETHMPRATEHVAQMIALIERLIERGHAYVGTDGCVYFAVQSFPEYGRLSGNTLDRLRSGAGGRVQDRHQSVKRHPADFLLWKPDPSHIMRWPSPWGDGYPGWHIECSAMSLHTLSKLAGTTLHTIDIHTGGEDNIFPHHECEIAQSVCAHAESGDGSAADATGGHGLRSFARFWMHTRFLLVDGQKMSKSKGNFHTVRDVLEGRATGGGAAEGAGGAGVSGVPGVPGVPGVDPAVLRYELLKSHYRTQMNFTAESLRASAAAVQRLRDAEAGWRRDLPSEGGAGAVEDAVSAIGRDPASHDMVRGFAEALCDDLNMSAALAHVFAWLREAKGEPATAIAALRCVDSVLAVLPSGSSTARPSDRAAAGGSASDGKDPAGDEAMKKAVALDAARRARDFASADRLRKELQDAGYEVQTSKDGTTIRKKLA